MQILTAPRASAILYSLLLSQEDKRPWLLPANICPIVPITFLKARTPIEFVDISADTLHMDLDQVEDRLKQGSFGGVLYAHTYGELSTPNEIFQSLKSSNPELLIVDDRCLCIPDLDPPSNSIADYILYSTGYAKFVDLNFGGYAFIGEDTKYNPANLSYNPLDYDQLESSYKRAIHSRSNYIYQDSDWLQTEDELLPWKAYRQQIENGLHKSHLQRANLNQIYRDRLPPEIQLSQPYQSWRFNIRIKNQQRVQKAIFQDGLFASTHYASLAGIMASGHCPNAETLAAEIINLFNDDYFDLEKAKRICEIILGNISGY